MSTVRALVLTGFGLNCDVETAYSLKLAGAEADRVHINSLISKEQHISNYQIMVIGGGFSWGDDHGAGVIMAMRLKHRMQDDILSFVEKGGVVIGICNGFQVLVNLGLLPGFLPGQLEREVALIANDCGNFRDQWVQLRINPRSPCVLNQGITMIELPVRHGEGKFYASSIVIEKLVENQQVFMQYTNPEGEVAKGAFPHNPNGSVSDIAGICDITGRIVGMMPHPEAYNHFTNHPDWTRFKDIHKQEKDLTTSEGRGVSLLRGAVRHFL
jgi:phosphoribosylformylglycinamidine synthase I